MSDDVVDLATVSDEVLAQLMQAAGLTLRGVPAADDHVISAEDASQTRERMISDLIACGIAQVQDDGYDWSLLTEQERRTIERANGQEVAAAGGRVYRDGVGPTGVATDQAVMHEGGRANTIGQPQRVWRGL